MESGLESVRTNLINFVFASLMLGLTCMRKTSQHNGWRGIITSFLHEGLPMVMYGQILTWGQSGCCLLVLSIAEILDIPIPPHFATIVPLGLESGEHIVALNYITDPVDVSKRGTKWAHTVLAESEALGLLTVSLLAIVLMSGKQFFIACGAIDQEASHPSRTVRPVAGHGAGQAEAFERSAPKHLQSAFSVDDTEDVSGDQINGNHNDNKNNIASLGSHLSLIALAVFISFGVSFLLQLLEIEIKWTQYLIAGIPVFKLSMIAALVCMQIILARTPFLRFRREWFMRLCGLMLDLLIICALSVAYPDIGSLEGTHYMLCSLFVLVCILWNVFCFLYIAKELFPNYWFTRAITLSGMVVGHSYMGLLMARTLDPYLLSPVPVAFVSKLMLIFIPSTTIKNSILVNLVENQSHWLALVICWLIVATWFFIFESHFRHRFVSSKKSEDDPENDSILRGVKDINDIEYSRLSRGMPSSSNIPSSSDQQRYLHEESTGLEMSEEPDSNNTASTGSRAPRSDLTLTMSSENSSIITAQQMNLIASWLPAAQSDRSWTLKYSLRRDGASMATLMSKCVVRDKYGHPVQTTSVIVIEDSWGYIFGGFLGHAFENKPV